MYIDPGIGALILTALAGLILYPIVFLKSVRDKVKNWLKRGKD